ncbi:MAG TPA: class I tRNA ligase family protein, partial [Methylomirabilota bacterium]|nr:class I tRNA ligase family protein [Methylomirabilota bacterium]
GKDILRFHAVYWPAMLLSAGAPLPTTILVHGFLMSDGRRMSKTLGTGVDPVALADTWSADAVRYWLLREVPPAGDANYTPERFARAYTSGLANDLGNLLHRTAGMMHRYRAGVVPARCLGAVSALEPVAAAILPAIDRGLGERWDPPHALEAIFALVAHANRVVAETTPWTLARDERKGDGDARARLDRVLWDLAESLRVIGEGLRPFLPATAQRITRALGLAPAPDWRGALAWGGSTSAQRIATPAPLFPRPTDPRAVG